jgi:DNA repair exonuclease SbcCD ATPase subunit
MIMGEWELDIENIAGFSGSKSIKLISGLNWIFGENATGKSSVVNTLKILNNLKQFFKNINKVDDPRTFLHHGRASGKVLLQNSGKSYFMEFNPVFTSGGSGKLIEEKISSHLISTNPHVVEFAFIDTSNAIMNSIEFNGNIQLLKERIREESRIKDYFKILDITKVLFKKYKDMREDQIKVYGYKVKELNLALGRKADAILAFEKDISAIQDSAVDESQVQELKRLKQLKEKVMEDINHIRLKNIDQLTTEITNLHLRNKKIAESLKDANQEYEKLKDYKEIERTIRNLKMEQGTLTTKKTELIKSIEAKKSEISEKFGQKRVLDETINSEKQQCVHCLNQIDRKMLSQHIIKLEAEIKKIKDDQSNISQELDGIITKIKNKNQRELELQKIPASQVDIERSINSFTKDLSAIQVKIKEKTEEKKQFEGTLKTHQDQLTELNQKLINLSSINEEARNSYLKKISQINTLKDERKKITDQKEDTIRKSLLVSDNISKLLKMTEHVMNEIAAFIEKYYYTLIDETNTELAKMKEELGWGFKGIRINDDLDIEIKNQEGMKIDFSTLSDFERKSISILILYIMKNKFYPDYPLFVIDEHMNSADEKRCAIFVKMILQREAKKSNHIFLVTSNKHNALLEKGQENVVCDALTIFHVK